MSYSLQEPEWPPTCECLYDETRDEMFRGDCPQHCDLDDEDRHAAELLQVERKPPASIEATSRKRRAKRGQA